MRQPLVLPPLSDVVQMIEQRPKNITLRMIATVANTTEVTIRNIVAGKSKNPGYQHIADIYAFLNQQAN